MFCENGVLRNLTQFTGKQLCQSLFLNKAVKKKETLTQVFSCELCEIFTNTFSYWTPLVAASDTQVFLSNLNNLNNFVRIIQNIYGVIGPHFI